MSYQATTYRTLIASPGDVAAERAAIPEVIHAWNAEHSLDNKVVLLPVGWERDAVPEMGDRPQAIINKQLVESCDVLIGAFWTRIGTHTGVAESGTVERSRSLSRRESLCCCISPLHQLSSRAWIRISIDGSQNSGRTWRDAAWFSGTKRSQI